MSRTSAPTRSTAALLPALLLAVCCLGAKVSRLVPPEPVAPLSVSGKRVSVPAGGLDIAFEVLEAPERVRFLEECGAGVGQDPFAPDPGGRFRFATFRFDLANRTREEVTLHPAGVLAIVDDTPHFPLEYTAAYEHFVSRRRLDPALLESLQKCVFLETIVLPAGGRTSGLLAFRDLPERFKKFRIAGGNILVGAESRSFMIPFGVKQEKAGK